MTFAGFVDGFLTVVLVILALMVLTCMIKAVIGPRVGDRIICVNMMGTMVIVIIAILAIKMDEGYLADISVLYAMISFLAVVVLCKVYMSVYMERKNRRLAAPDNAYTSSDAAQAMNAGQGAGKAEGETVLASGQAAGKAEGEAVFASGPAAGKADDNTEKEAEK